MAFNVGDRVKVIDQGHLARNLLGEVREVTDEDIPYKVRIDGNAATEVHAFTERQLGTTTIPSPIDYE